MAAVKHTAVVMGRLRTVARVLSFAKFVVGCLEGNSYLPDPTPGLAQVLADVAALDAAEVLTRNRAPGAASARDVKLLAVMADLHGLRSYVQAVADASPPELGPVIIGTSGFKQRRAAVRSKAPLQLSMGLGRQVIVRGRAARSRNGAAYEWQYSLDGGASWISLPVTTVADTTLEGLAAGTQVLCRYRSTVGRVATDWSQVVSFIAH